METAQGRARPSCNSGIRCPEATLPGNGEREDGRKVWEVACVQPFMKTSEWMVGHTGRAVSVGCVSFSCGYQSPPRAAGLMAGTPDHSAEA